MSEESGRVSNTERRPWNEDFKERFQTIGSASLAWHPMLVRAFPSQGKLVVHTRDWSVSEKVDRAELEERVRSICAGHGMHKTANRISGDVTEQDIRAKNIRFWHFCFAGEIGCVVARGAKGYPTELDGTVFDQAILDAVGKALVEMDAGHHEPETAGMEYLSAGPGGIELVHQSSLGTKLERANYDEASLAFYDRVVSELPGGKNGRLAIMTGTPGGGKTNIVKGWLTDLAATCQMVYVPAALIPAVGRPELMPVLIAHHQKHKKPVVLILEDADEVLLPRGADNMSGISTLLNLTDGLQSDQANVRVIATSNARREKMDLAVGRQGRFFGHLDVKKRKPEHAMAIWERIRPGELYPFPATAELHLGEIYTGKMDEESAGSRTTGFR